MIGFATFEKIAADRFNAELKRSSEFVQIFRLASPDIQEILRDMFIGTYVMAMSDFKKYKYAFAPDSILMDSPKDSPEKDLTGT